MITPTSEKRLYGKIASLICASLAPNAGHSKLEESVTAARRLPQEHLLALLDEHQLAVLWWYALRKGGFVKNIEGGLCRALDSRTRRARVMALRRDLMLKELSCRLQRSGIPWIVFKGAQLAEEAYEETFLRVGVDSDVVVLPRHKEEVARILEEMGLTPKPGFLQATAQHDFGNGGELVDLHWEILRPGRSRISLAELAIEKRKKFGEVLWVADPPTTLAVLMIHTAISDYVTQRLVRALDILRWVYLFPESVAGAVDEILRSGVAPGAWLVGMWLKEIFGWGLPEEELNRLRPGWFRCAYLRRWLKNDPLRCYERHRLVTQGAFSLVLQENGADILRALVHFFGDSCRKTRI